MATTIATTMVTTDYLYAANAAIIIPLPPRREHLDPAFYRLLLPYYPTLLPYRYLPTPTPYYFTIIVT